MKSISREQEWLKINVDQQTQATKVGIVDTTHLTKWKAYTLAQRK